MNSQPANTLILRLLALLTLVWPSLGDAAINGSFPVTESYTVTLTYRNWGSSSLNATRTYTGTLNGTLAVNNNTFTLIDSTGLPGGVAATGASASRTISGSAGSYSISGDNFVLRPVAGAEIYGIIFLSHFTISVVIEPDQLPSAINGFTRFTTSGSSLASLNGSGNVRYEFDGLVVNVSTTSSLTGVPVAPVITTNPVNVTTNTGAAVTFTVAATGTAPLSYQWQKNSTNLVGAVNPTYSIASVQSADAGTYRAVVSNSGGSTTSSSATLAVLQPPAVTAHPTNLLVLRTNVLTVAPATFTVVGTGTAPLRYQWFLNGSALANATNSTLTFPDARFPLEGSYYVRITNSAGSILSSNANLTVRSPRQVSSPQRRVDGSFAIVFGDPDSVPLTAAHTNRFEVQVCTNLTGAVWTTLAGTQTLTNGQLLLVDADSPSHLRRFYRVVER